MLGELKSLLATKLLIPPARQSLVPRPRLTARLKDGLTRPVVLISAPAGFGKTTLAHEGRATIPALAWLSLDADDKDPVRFLAYFLAALQGVAPGIGDTARALLQSSQAPPPTAVMAVLINDLSALREPILLVLDDYHLITAQPIHAALGYLIDHQPAPLHLLLTTRSDPPLPLARLRAGDQLAEIRARELRFTPDEAGDFLGRVMGLQLSTGDLAALEQRTEGWIVGLQLAALSMRDRDDLPGFIQAFTGSHRHVMDYLLEEVFDRQPPEIQDFLLNTSILERLSGALCEAVLAGLSSSRMSYPALLDQLEHGNLFLMALDDERRWYRYHQLFADLLQNRLAQTHPDRAPELHRRASRWFEANGTIAEAIRHAVRGQDFDQAARLMEQTARPMVMRGEFVTLRGWLGSLPEASLRTRPRLQIARAWAALSEGSLAVVEESVAAAEAAQTSGPDAAALVGELAAVRATLAAIRGNAAEAIELSEQARARLPVDDYLQALVGFNLGLAYALRNESLKAERALAEAARLSQGLGNLFLAVSCLCQQAEQNLVLGRLRQVEALYQAALAQATGRSGQKLPPAVLPLTGLADVRYERNDLEGAERCLVEAIRLSGQWNATAAFDAHLALARVKQARGNNPRALAELDLAEELVANVKAAPVTKYIQARRVRLWVAMGSAEAGRWAREYESSASDASPVIREIEQIALARVWLAEGQFKRVLPLLGQLADDAEASGRHGRLIEICLLRAQTHQRLDQPAQALQVLRRSLILAGPEGYVRAFIDEGQALQALLVDLRRRRPAGGDADDARLSNYAGRLLAAWPAGQVGEASPSRPQPPRAAMIEPLNERELEVLGLIAAGDSNAQIADKLVLAQSTVKWHIHNLYGKLGAGTRTQALARARELGLL